MKKFISASITFFFCITVQFVFSQTYELLSFKKTKDTKIEIGMSIQEVKKAFGSPKSIELGFPEDEETIIQSFPNMKGQLNYSTWLYVYDPIYLDLNENTNQGYFINNIAVSKFDYDSYKDLAEVYLYEGKIINPSMASSYKQVKSPKLSSVPKTEQHYNPNEIKSKKSPLIPVYCIIFEKGTQVVIKTKAYLLR
jgi:hypothetical protein